MVETKSKRGRKDGEEEEESKKLVLQELEVEVKKRSRPSNNQASKQEDLNSNFNQSSPITNLLLKPELILSEPKSDPHPKSVSDPKSNNNPVSNINTNSDSSTSSSPLNFKDLDEDEREKEIDNLIKKLLEASDDELGIPNTEMSGEVGGGFSLFDGLWEFAEDDGTIVNKYTF